MNNDLGYRIRKYFLKELGRERFSHSDNFIIRKFHSTIIKAQDKKSIKKYKGENIYFRCVAKTPCIERSFEKKFLLKENEFTYWTFYMEGIYRAAKDQNNKDVLFSFANNIIRAIKECEDKGVTKHTFNKHIMDSSLTNVSLSDYFDEFIDYYFPNREFLSLNVEILDKNRNIIQKIKII